MGAEPVVLDTSLDVQQRVLERFKSMTLSERAATAQSLSDMCTDLALAGMRHQHGELSAENLRWHLAARRYGRPLADQVYGSRYVR